MLKKIISCIICFIFIQNIVFSKLIGNTYKFNPEEKIGYINIEFFKDFNDDILINYIINAIKCNHTGKIAALKVDEYYRLSRMSLSDELPYIGVSAFYNGIKLPHISNFNNYAKSGFILPFFFKYEADLLLKNRNKTQSKNKLVESSQYDEKSVYISLISGLVTTYINIIKTNKVYNLQSQIVKLKKDDLYREKKRMQSGVTTKNIVNTKYESYYEEMRQLEVLKKNLEILITQFCIYLGLSPENKNDLVFCDFNNFEYKEDIKKNLSFELIFNRPDIISVEKKLESAKIDIKVARKEFFPRFNIFGAYVFNTFGNGNFFSWESTLAAILAGLSQDIFTGGKKVHNLRLKQNKYKQLFQQYFQTVLEAQKNALDSINNYDYDNNVLNITKNTLNTQKKNTILTEKRFMNGTISYSDTISDKVMELKYEIALLDAKASILIDILEIYKAFGAAV